MKVNECFSKAERKVFRFAERLKNLGLDEDQKTFIDEIRQFDREMVEGVINGESRWVKSRRKEAVLNALIISLLPDKKDVDNRSQEGRSFA